MGGVNGDVNRRWEWEVGMGGVNGRCEWRCEWEV